MRCSFLPLGNDRFRTQERQFLLVGTTVSFNGNERFLLWERQFPHMGTEVSP